MTLAMQTVSTLTLSLLYTSNQFFVTTYFY
jgi:hypothetical protein